MYTDVVVENSNAITFPDGNMKTRGWIFDGIRVIQSEIIQKQATSFDWYNTLDVVHLHFTLRGKSLIKHSGFNKTFAYNQYEHNIAYSNGFKGVIENEGTYNETFIIQFNREAFFKITQNTSEQLMLFGEEIMKGKPVLFSDRNLGVNMPLYAAIQGILNCELTGKIKKMYLMSKCIEILVLQADAFEKNADRKYVYCKTTYDKERIFYARDYLLEHIADPPTLSELAKIAGINEFKLKKGFKEVFNNTVFGYLSNLKMEIARKELQRHEKTSSELAFDLGYSSPQHFSMAFKKRFGVSPSRIK